MEAPAAAKPSAPSTAPSANPHLEEARRLAAQVNKRLEAEMELDAAEKAVAGVHRALHTIEDELAVLQKKVAHYLAQRESKEMELSVVKRRRDKVLAVCQQLRDLTPNRWRLASPASQPDGVPAAPQRVDPPTPADGAAAGEDAAEAAAVAALLGFAGGVTQRPQGGDAPLGRDGGAESGSEAASRLRARTVDGAVDESGASHSTRHAPPVSDAQAHEHEGADAPSAAASNGDSKHYLEYDAAKAAAEDVMVVRRRGTAQWKVMPPGKGETMFQKDPLCARLEAYAKPVGPASWFVLRTYPGKNMIKWSSSSVKAGVKGVAALRRHLLGPPGQSDTAANGSAGGLSKGSKRRGGAESEPAASPTVQGRTDGPDEDAGAGKRRKVVSLSDPSASSPVTGKSAPAEALSQRSANAASSKKDAAPAPLPELDAVTAARLAAIPTYKVLSVKGVNFSVLPQGVKAVKGVGSVEPIITWARRCVAEHPGFDWGRDLLVNGHRFDETDTYKLHKA